MKKFIQFIVLMCCCVVFTGCSGNSNSFDNADTNAYRIYVSENIINKGNNTMIASGRAASAERVDAELFSNGVEFPGHSSDAYGNYIFTKVMYESEASQIISAASNTIRIMVGLNTKPIEIVYDRVLPQNTYIDGKANSDEIHMHSDSGEIDVYLYNGVQQAGLTKVKNVRIEKVNSVTAKVTLLNGLGQGLHKSFNYWKITGVDINTGDTGSYTYTENETEKGRFFIITPSGEGDSKFYTITLTSKGEAKSDASSHTLDNTEIQINEIKLNGEDVVEKSILSKVKYIP